MHIPASGVLVVFEIHTYLSLILSPALLCRPVPVQACTHLPVCSATAPATLWVLHVSHCNSSHHPPLSLPQNHLFTPTSTIPPQPSGHLTPPSPNWTPHLSINVTPSLIQHLTSHPARSLSHTSPHYPTPHPLSHSSPLLSHTSPPPHFTPTILHLTPPTPNPHYPTFNPTLQIIQCWYFTTAVCFPPSPPLPGVPVPLPRRATVIKWNRVWNANCSLTAILQYPFDGEATGRSVLQSYYWWWYRSQSRWCLCAASESVRTCMHMYVCVQCSMVLAIHTHVSMHIHCMYTCT